MGTLEYLKEVNRELDNLDREVITKIKSKDREEGVYDEVNPTLLR